MNVFTGQNFIDFVKVFYTDKSRVAYLAVKLFEKNQVNRYYIKAIDNYSAKSLTSVLRQPISKSANEIVLIMIEYSMQQIALIRGKLHTTIYQRKSWIRTTSTHASKKDLKNYFNECAYTINPSQNKFTIFHNIISRIINASLSLYDTLLQKINVQLNIYL